jgi:hypothetical protein
MNSTELKQIEKDLNKLSIQISSMIGLNKALMIHGKIIICMLAISLIFLTLSQI